MDNENKIDIELPCFFVDSVKWQNDDDVKNEIKNIFEYAKSFEPMMNTFQISILNINDSYDPKKIQEAVYKIRKEGQKQIKIFSLGKMRTYNLDKNGKIQIKCSAQYKSIYEWKYDWDPLQKIVLPRQIVVDFDFAIMKLIPKINFQKFETFMNHWKERRFLLFWVVDRYTFRVRMELNINIEDNFIFKDNLSQQLFYKSPDIHIPDPKEPAHSRRKSAEIPSMIDIVTKDIRYFNENTNQMNSTNEIHPEQEQDEEEEVEEENGEMLNDEIIDNDKEKNDDLNDSTIINKCSNFHIHDAELIHSLLQKGTKIGEGSQSNIIKVDLKTIDDLEKLGDLKDEKALVIKVLKEFNENKDNESDFSYDEDDDNSNDNDEILKTDQPHFDIDIIRKFFAEYEILISLNHQNIIKCYGFYFGDNTHQPCIILPYCGHNLEISIKRLTKINKVSIIFEICDAMKYVHQKGLIHRDLKPSNILLDSKKHVKICDFGTIKLKSDDSYTRGVGIFGFMAPEILSNDNYDEKVDVYSFGKILYYLLTNDRNLSIDFENMPEDINDFSSNLIQKCISIEPKDRPSFAEIIDMIVQNDFKIIDGIEDKIESITKHIGYKGSQ